MSLTALIDYLHSVMNGKPEGIERRALQLFRARHPDNKIIQLTGDSVLRSVIEKTAAYSDSIAEAWIDCLKRAIKEAE